MKDKIWDVLQVIGYIAGTIVYVGGMVHSFNKHGNGDGILSVFIPPWAIYRGVEMFWHDDYRGVDWIKKIKDDIESTIYFVNTAPAKETDTYKLNEEMDEFSKKISEYPKAKYDELKTGTKEYIEFSVYFMDDFLGWKNKMANRDTTFEYSKKTLVAVSDLVNKYGLIELKQLPDSTLKMYKQFATSSYFEYQDKIDDFFNKMANNKDVYTSSYYRTFKRIFNDSLTFQ
ncbi:MAG: hypothetical protein V4439_04435 [Patescibacteria group bacterium]